MPFLRNVTRGRGVPDSRLEEVAHHYAALNGRSPVNALNLAIIDGLRAELAARNVNLPVYFGNRNWYPMLAETVGQMYDDGHRNVLAITTSAYSSYSSCRQYREDFAAALAANSMALDGPMRIDRVRTYFNHPGFLDPLADGLARAVAELVAAGHERSKIIALFSTHSIPTMMADTSGPKDTWVPGSGGWYVSQHRLAVNYVLGRVEDLAHQLVFQSRSGSPHTPWLEPDVNDVIAGLDGFSAVVVVPIGFVSDHVEVLWDLDNEAAQTAREHQLAFRRVATPGKDPRFVAALACLVRDRLDAAATPVCIPGSRPIPDVCLPGCCPNPRAVKPTTAGVDSSDDWARAGQQTQLLK